MFEPLCQTTHHRFDKKNLIQMNIVTTYMMGTVVEISGQKLSTLDSFWPINQVKKKW